MKLIAAVVGFVAFGQVGANVQVQTTRSTSESCPTTPIGQISG